MAKACARPTLAQSYGTLLHWSYSHPWFAIGLLRQHPKRSPPHRRQPQLDALAQDSGTLQKDVFSVRFMLPGCILRGYHLLLMERSPARSASGSSRGSNSASLAQPSLTAHLFLSSVASKSCLKEAMDRRLSREGYVLLQASAP